MNTLSEWLLAVVLCMFIALVLAIGGVLLSTVFVFVTVTLIVAFILEGFSSLFPSTKEKGTREEGREDDDTDQ